ncbi:MAG: pantoate--beta-alanine ligase [delta proteobacterium ML8_F1]|nr:MAG: pantoate--beta-alanine ligase [delta proteobacterium ML8_F1]
MERISDISVLNQSIEGARRQGLTVGLVPTMGFLHRGHLSLVKAARAACDFVVVSIFVNPTQFAPGEDLEDYPRNLQRDEALLQEEGVDVVFLPSVADMYPRGFNTLVKVGEEMTSKLCGKSRPTHFNGVTTVVAKLFNLVRPHKAFFGQKDAQQLSIIRRMVKDLNFNIEILSGPIVREEDGLALSSRNVYLSEEERRDARVLSQSLGVARAMVGEGILESRRIIHEMQSLVAGTPRARVDYIEIVDPETLEPLERIAGKALVALAVYVGKTRLIDNWLLEDQNVSDNV